MQAKVNPGVLGFTHNDGIITSVNNNKLQRSLRLVGMIKGWKIIKIENQPYTRELLDIKRNGTEMYWLQFAVHVYNYFLKVFFFSQK